MLVFNQQANIKNVNGAIADIFVNRPAAQSTYYIFYSTDTQQIFYDNGAWILIGSGGGGGVNIYNSDGTLTGNRTLSGANNDLNFSDLNVFKTSVGGNDIGLKLDFANQLYTLGDPGNFAGGFSFIIDDLNGVITTQTSPGVNGLYFDFANDYYRIGAISNLNATYFEVDNANQIIKTSYQGNDIGIKFQFPQTKFSLGDFNNIYNGGALIVDSGAPEIYSDFNGQSGFLTYQYVFNAGDFNNLQNGTSLFINDNNQLIKTTNRGNDIGLQLLFASNRYEFGDYNVINNGTLITIDDLASNIQLIAGFNATNLRFVIDEVNAEIKSRKGNIDIGLKLDFANANYLFGDFTSNAYLVSDAINIGISIGDYYGNGNYTEFRVNDTNSIIKSTFNQNDIGLKLDFANTTYKYGQLTGGNETFIYINDTSQLLYTANNGNISNGLYCDFAAHVYQFGRATGGNTTYLTIDDAATYPIQIDGTNVLSGSSGSTSGQHLKININGTDYKIELKNP